MQGFFGLCLIVMVVAIFFIPPFLAKERGIERGQILVVWMLTFASFILPLLWFVALIMAAVCKGKK